MNLDKWNRLLKTQDFPNVTTDFWLPWSAWLNEFIPDKSKNILIIGCSEEERILTRHAGYVNITCIDFWAGKGVIQMDMHDLKFPKESFDYVLAKSVLEHSHSPFMLMLEARSVLKIGGLFILTVEWDMEKNYSSTHPFLTSNNDLENYRKIFGFTLVTEHNWGAGGLQTWRKESEVPDDKYHFRQFVIDWENDFH